MAAPEEAVAARRSWLRRSGRGAGGSHLAGGESKPESAARGFGETDASGRPACARRSMDTVICIDTPDSRDFLPHSDQIRSRVILLSLS